MFQVRDSQKALRAIAFVRHGLVALFLLLALFREEKILFLGLALLAFLMARTGYCPLIRR
ncbi:hypothetical protein [Thermus tenuipuniceus]|uniref:hypothetical protein n=1 Tax=Thermus tenuipuniceus TaxID=2078690 RepID=UPI000CF89825|nr:hypothetical protein [Thermus tenuipuniceus]